MGLSEAANLIINLRLKDFATPAIKAAQTNIAKMGTSFSKIGGLAKQGLGTAVDNLKKIGLAAGAAGIAIGTMALKSGLDSLAQLEDATTSVTGAIQQMGLTGKVTADQVAGWANQIESDVQAAFDDKDITAATATLIRFGHITSDNIKPAMVIMTDLATKTGDVGSAADLLAKALADPEKAAGKLARTGVILTQQQQDQITAMQEAGDVAGAQAVLLDALAESTKGAAAASKGPYNDAINTLKDTWEDLTRALAVGFLPVIQEISTYLKGKLADPGFLNTVKGFGTSLAGALKDALDAAKKIPWSSIGDAMKLAGQGAKAAYDLFMGLPDWVKTAVITGWGLNKLTGGALGGIVGELAKGLVKGILGITAAQVNITAATATLTGPGATAAVASEAATTGTSMVGALKAALGAAFTVATAYLIFKPVADTIGTLIGGALGTKPAAPNTPGSLFLGGTPFGGGFDIRQYRIAHGLDPQTGLPVSGGTGSRLAPGSIGVGPGFGKVEASTERTAEGVDELKRINQQAANQLGQISGVVPQIAPKISSFLMQWAGAHDAAVAAGFKSGTEAIRREIASKLGITVNELGKLRTSFRTSLAQELGVTTGELRHLRQSTHYDEQRMADKLGISVEQLREIKDKARSTAANTAAIKNKNWSPKITVPVTITNKVAISGRQIYNATQRQIIRQGGGPIVE